MADGRLASASGGAVTFGSVIGANPHETDGGAGAGAGVGAGAGAGAGVGAGGGWRLRGAMSAVVGHRASLSSVQQERLRQLIERASEAAADQEAAAVQEAEAREHSIALRARLKGLVDFARRAAAEDSAGNAHIHT